MHKGTEKMKRLMMFWLVLIGMVGIILSGCAPVLIGAGAAGGYKVVTDERSAGDMVDDTTITTHVHQALGGEPGVNQYRIDVDTLEGRVTLTGMVSSAEESQLAVNLAREVKGVVAVRNNLQVGSKSFGQTLNDKLLVTKIKSKLIVKPGVRALNIDVDAVAGVVTLSGIVAAEAQRATILLVARETGGVRSVVDNLVVRRP